MKTSISEAKLDLFAVAPGVWGMKDIFVNVYVINNPAENNWFLVDTGVSRNGSKIKQMAALLFGAGAKPAAIILTHGHFDHIGSLRKLLAEWDVPVYAHHLEIPYLTGVSSYPPPDPTVGGGLMAELSFLYPRGPIDIEDKVISLPQGGRIPGLPEWAYIHTPGHAPGHISLFREKDKVLIAGDAFVTTKQESALSVMLQLKKISGPPRYFTADWLSAASSVGHLANLDAEIVATGHGRPMRGEGMRKSLHNLARNFVHLAVPRQGRYVYSPALMDDSGVVHIPPSFKSASSYTTLKVLGITAGVLLTVLLFKNSKRKKRKKEKAAVKAAHKAAAKEAKKLKSEGKNRWEEAKQPLLDKAHEAGKNLKNKAADTRDDVWDRAKEGSKQLRNRAEDASSYAKDRTNDLSKKAMKEGSKIRSAAKSYVDDAEDAVHDTRSAAKKEWKKGKDYAEDSVDDARSAVKKQWNKGKRYAEDSVDDARSAAKKQWQKGKEYAEDSVDDARSAAKKEWKKGKEYAADEASHLGKLARKQLRSIEKPVLHWLDKFKFDLTSRN